MEHCGETCKHDTVVTQAEADWVNEQVGEVKIEIGKLDRDNPVLGFKDYVCTIHLPNTQLYCQTLMGPEYGEMEAHEIAQMLGRVLRSHYVRTRLLPLLGDIGELH